MYDVTITVRVETGSHADAVKLVSEAIETKGKQGMQNAPYFTMQIQKVSADKAKL